MLCKIFLSNVLTFRSFTFEVVCVLLSYKPIRRIIYNIVFSYLMFPFLMTLVIAQIIL